QRLRFEHPEVGAVIITSEKERVFCAGANIGMLSAADHMAKVNFCKFTNETRCAIEQASGESGQHYLAVINGSASGGGYELALACEHIMLVDDGASAVALPEVPLLGVLPGTGGLTRLVDKRRVRRDRADLFCTTTEGVRGERALEWSLVDELVPASKLDEKARIRAVSLSQKTGTSRDAQGIDLVPLVRKISRTALRYPYLKVDIDSTTSVANFTVCGPDQSPPVGPEASLELGAAFWPLALARALDDAILHLRTNRPDISNWVIRVVGNGSLIRAHDDFIVRHDGDWLLREIRLYWTRVLKRLDVTSRSLIALIEAGDGCSGTLFELALACDRIYMLDGNDSSAISLSAMNFGRLPMANGLSRLQTRFLGDSSRITELRKAMGKLLSAQVADSLGLVTGIPDEIDWDEEVRLAIEERSSFSGDALTGLEANLRFAGPETIETKIFGRLSAWQNWIFQRPNAVGPEGSLRLYGTGQRAQFDKMRV
ncbi:MAG TPA: benzoyl-CoA-dihydrodiol lyase, partial [Alphaproteobacteria bacterium]|nr:benzoyl-CoA-dihydrodiol lyase [Alphaproteobacteria bacterium]